MPRAGGDYPGLPPLPQVALDDEVGVLARAIASREEALRRFVQRESFFTGDVSHELRTPLTVMQGGLEVLELQLERLPGSERCAPTVERLQRTVRDMSATVGILLLLARRPENIELEPVDLALLVRDTAQGQDCFSLELPESREVQAQPALAGSSSRICWTMPGFTRKMAVLPCAWSSMCSRCATRDASLRIWTSLPAGCVPVPGAMPRRAAAVWGCRWCAAPASSWAGR